MKVIKPLIFTFLVLPFIGCVGESEVRSSATEVTEIEISDLPQNIVALINEAQPDFRYEEVQKKIRDGRVYYDVEGLIGDDREIEFDVLMTLNGPEIVEIQRDISIEYLPETARLELEKINIDQLVVTRIIESKQTDNSVIYELFVEGNAADPRFEIMIKNGKASLLEERWKH